MIRSISLVLASWILVLSGLHTARAEEPNAKPTDEKVAKEKPTEPTQADLEKQFAEDLSGATLVGRYTTDGQEDAKQSEEKYVIRKVAKIKDDRWLFIVRMQFGDIDMNLPLQLTVRWAGDTPVITLTDLTIPGLGTFTSRVAIYRGRYAGTWQHGKMGGHLFGKVVKEAAAAADTSDSKNPSN